MKLLLSFLLFFCFSFNFAQEIEHRHSIQHAFIENKGQWAENVLFKSKFHGGNLWIEQGKMMFHLQDYSAIHASHIGKLKGNGKLEFSQDVVNLNFKGSQKVTQIEKGKPTDSYYNYFMGNDPSKWTSNVRGYNEAKMKNLYAGIDFNIIEELEQLKYEFHVAPNVNPKLIQLEFVGQKKIHINRAGQLNVETKLGVIREDKPFAYQIINGKIKEISCRFLLKENVVQFELGKYDKSVELIIDPVLIFATYSGSVTDNFGMTATYGYDGTAYSGGTIFGNAYPTPDPNAYNTTSNMTVTNVFNSITTDVFISKYSADGTTMLWTTFLGGGDDSQGTETVNSLICDKQNNIYAYGVTSSTDFPMVNAFQSVFGGGTNLVVSSNGTNFGAAGTDIYVAKISANGHNLLGSTYMGGSQNDGANYNIYGSNSNYAPNNYDSLSTNYGDQYRGEIMLDSANNILVASCSRSADFPVLNAVQATNGGMQDGVVFQLTPDLSSLRFSTYIGGSNNDACYSVKIDSSYNIVFSGGTNSNNLPASIGAYQTTYQGGKADGFVGKLTPDGSSLTALSYLGTSNYDQAFFVEIDRNDNVFLLGQSRGGTFPVVNAGYSNPNSGQFIAKMTPDLTTLSNSTVFGNGNTSLNISPAAFLVDFCGNIYVSGWGGNILTGPQTTGMAVTSDAFLGTSPNGFDFYLMVLDRDFDNLLYGSYIGGNQANEHVDGGTSRFDKNGVVYQSVCGGCGGVSDFPTSQNAWSNSNLSSNCNNILFKFDFEITPKAEFTVDQSAGCAPFSVVFDNTSTSSETYLWDFGDGNVDSTTFNPSITYNLPGQYTVYLFVTDSICQLTDTAEITINVYDSLVVDAGADVSMCAPTQLTFTGNSFGSGTTFIWSSNANFTDQLNATTTDSTLTITPSETTTYYFQASNPLCSEYDSVTVTFTSSSLVLSGDSALCVGESTQLTAVSNNPSIVFDYQWSPNSVIQGASNQNTVTVNPSSSQYIYVTATTNTGCIVQDSIFIGVSDISGVAVQASASEYTIPEGATVTLFGQPSGYVYSWSPTNGVNSPTSQQTTATVDQTTIFTFTVSDAFCSKSDTVHIKTLKLLCEEPFIFVPSAFSPNADQENDVLYVRGAVLESMLFRVFDRWGELVFESTSRSEGWDGTFKGRACDPDVYDYYLEGECYDGQKALIKGNITLLK